MVRVLTVAPDVNRCQWVLPSDHDFALQGNLFFDGLPRLDSWNPPRFYIQNPLKDKSNFFIVASGAFAFDQTVREDPILSMFLEMAGEILPIELETGEPLYVLNVTQIGNALDQERSGFRKDPSTGVVVTVEKYMFHANRLPESPIFKIPETRRAKVLTFAGRYANPDDEFYEPYHRSGFTGLKFQELWNSEEVPNR